MASLDERGEDPAVRSQALVLLKHVIQLLLLRPYRLLQFICGLFHNIRGFTTLNFRTRKRQKLLAWLRQSLGPTRKVEDLTSIWRDGTILCDVIEDGVPGSCSKEVRTFVCHRSIQHGQDLAARHLGVKPVFTCEDLQQVTFSSYLERRLVRYLVNIRRALLDLKGGRLILETNIFPETGLELEPLTFDCVNGMGLKAAVQYCTASFYIYPQEVPTSKDFPITIQIEGSHGDFGEVEIKEISSTKKLFSSKFVVPKQRNHICNIPISYKLNSRYIRVTYVPQSIGTLDLCILMHGRHMKGSPFKITVDGKKDAAKLTNTPPKRRVRVLYRTVDFITEKMILTDDGKLQKLPNMEHILRHEMIYPFLDGGEHQDEPINNNKNNNGTELCNGESLTQISTINSDEEHVLTSKHKYLDIFKDRSRKLILMCKFLIKKSPHQILSSAEQIFDGRPVRLTDTTYKLIENALKSVKSHSNVANEHSTLLDGKPTVDSTNVQLRDSKYPYKELSLNKNAKKDTKLYSQNSSVEVTDEWVHLNNNMHPISSGTTCMQTKIIDNENEDDVKTLVRNNTEIKSEGMSSSTISKTCVVEYHNQKIHTNTSNDSAGFTGQELETPVPIKFSNLTMSEERLNSIDIDKKMHTNKGECHIVNVTDLNSNETKQRLKINEKFKVENFMQDKSVVGSNYDIKTKEMSFDHLHQYCELCKNLNNDNCTHANDADAEPLLQQPSEKCSIADNKMQIQIKPMIGKDAETEKKKGISKICTEEASNANEITRLNYLNSTASKTTQSQIRNNSPCISEVLVLKVELKTNDTSVLIEYDKRKVPYNTDDLSDCDNPTESNINVFLSASPHSLEHIPEFHKMEHSLGNKKVHAKCNSSSHADKFNMKMISHMLPSSSLYDKYFDASSKTDTTLSDEFTAYLSSNNIQSDNQLQDIALELSSYNKLEAEVTDIESILALPSLQATLKLERDLETAKEIQSHTESGVTSTDNMSSKSSPPQEISSTSTRTTDSSSDIQINDINNEGEELTQEPNQGENHDIGDSDYVSLHDLHSSFKQSPQNRENDITNENNKRVCNNASINIFTGLNSRTLQKEQSFHYHKDESFSYGSENSTSNESMDPAEKAIWGCTEDQTEKAEKIVNNNQHSYVDSTFISKSSRYFSRALSQDESLSIDTDEENKENNPLYKYVNLQSTLQTSSSVATLILTENCTKHQEIPCGKCNASIKETRQNVFKNTEKPEKCLTVSDIHSNCNNCTKPVTTFAKSSTQNDGNTVTHEVCGSKSEIFKPTANCLVKDKQTSENKNIVCNTRRNEMNLSTETVSENFDNISNQESTIQRACNRICRGLHIQDDRETVIHDVPQSKSEGTKIALNSLATNALISENKNTMNNNQISQTIKNHSIGSDTVSEDSNKSNEEPTIKDDCIVNNLSVRMNTGLTDTGEFNVEGQTQTNDGQISVTGLTSISATNGIIPNSFDINPMLTPADLNCISAETYQVVNNVIDTQIPDFFPVRYQHILSSLENSKPTDIINKVKNIYDFEIFVNCDIVLSREENETCHPQFKTCSSDMCLFKTLSDEDSTIKSTPKSNNGDTFTKNSSNDTTTYIKGYDKWFTPTEYIVSNHSEDNDGFLALSNTSNTISNTDIPSHKLHETEDNDKEKRLATGTDNLGGKNRHNGESELLDIKQPDRKKLDQLTTTKFKSTEKVNEEFLQTADYVDGFPATMGVTQRKQYWDQKLSSQSCNADIYGRDIHKTGKLQVHAKTWQNTCKNSNLNPTNEETPSIHTTGIIKKYKPTFEANYPAEKMHSDISTKVSVYSTDCKERKVSYDLMVNQVITRSGRENQKSLPAIAQLQVKESSCDKINHHESNEINFTAESTNIVPTAKVDHNFVTNDINEDHNYQPEHMQLSDSHPYINEITKQGINYITKPAICVKNTFENITCKEKSVTESDMEHYRTLYDPNILKIPCEKDIYRAKLVHVTEDGCKSPTPHSSFVQMRHNTSNIKNIHVSEVNSQTETSIEEITTNQLITSQAISHSCMAHHLIETGDKNKEKGCKHERDNRADSRSRFREAMKFFQTLEQKVSIRRNENKQRGTFPQTSRSLDLTDAEVENRGIISWRSLPRLEQTERFVVEKYPTHINNNKNVCRKCGKRKNKVFETSSAPTSDIESNIRSLKQNKHFEKFGGSERYPKKSIAERFHVKDLFKDITGDHNSLHGSGGLFRGIPNQQAVLTSLRSIDSSTRVSTYNAAKLPNDPDTIPLVGQSQRYQSEYPYIPTTPLCLYRPRSGFQTVELVPRKEIL